MNRWYKDPRGWKSSLAPGETVLAQCESVRLDDGENKFSSNGDIYLTTHRMIWTNKNSPDLILSLSLVALAEEETSSGFMKSEKITLHLTMPPPNPPGEPVIPSSQFHFVRLAFKNGGMKSFMPKLQDAVNQRKWHQTAPPMKKVPQAKVIRSGIGGIEKNMAAKARSTDVQISKAFQDLDALMEMAKPMVALANTMSKKIRDKQGDVSDDETIQFKSYLMSMGIADPVTREASSSKQTYFVQLAKEIDNVLRDPIKEAGGMMTLTDAYVRINRARGLELISPDEFLDACHSLENSGSSLRLHTFPTTGVKVLQLSSVLAQDIVVKTEAAVIEAGSLTSDELAKAAGIAVVLARERLLAAEEVGKVCRDDTVEGLRFYPNLFLSA